MNQKTESSPKAKSRIAGGLWLAVIIVGIPGFIISMRLIVNDDVAATGTNIVAHETLFRAGFIFEFISALCYVGVTALMYELLKPVQRTIALSAAFFGGVGVAIASGTFLCRLAPVALLHSDRFSDAFTIGQLQAMSFIALKLYSLGFNLGFPLFGIQCLLLGYLIFRSTFLPRVLGMLLSLGGSIYVIVSLINILFPTVGARLLSIMFLMAFLGEGSFSLWLLVRGVNADRWKETAQLRG